MKHYYISILSIAVLCAACGKLDYSEREYYKQEAYIIHSESTSATERELVNISVATYSDTLRVINDSYDVDTLWDISSKVCKQLFKVGIGGSQPAGEDIEILIDFDQELVDDYNTLNDLECYIPSSDKYTTNIPYDEVKGGFPVIIPKGESSAKLEFSFVFDRDTKANPNLKERDYAIPLKIKSASGGVEISRLYNTFLVTGFVTNVTRATDWSGYPVPSVPAGRYHSVRLQGNQAENYKDGVHYMWKYVLPLEDPDTPEDKRDPSLHGKYMIFGTGLWSWTVFAYHWAGWMWNLLELTDEVGGVYTMSPILEGNNLFPFYTFKYSTVQDATEDNHYDPKLKQLTLHYKNVIGSEYNDVLTYLGPPILDVWSAGSGTPKSWAELKAKGYQFWLPED